ncbi:MAG: twin-arginine translocation signal domain-containing protein [Coriobacteriia bacterium]|nr:twin-arginine translocation signal domain-containing protein [Coriobacteriia bacterium]
MEGTKLSRRQFLGGTAAVAAASVLPAVSTAGTAMATPAGKLADSAAALTPWVPIDVEKAARRGWETYKGRYNASDGQSG